MRMKHHLSKAYSNKDMSGNRVCSQKIRKASFSSENVFLSVSPSPPRNIVVSTWESSLNLNEPQDSTICHDVDTGFYAWIESLEAAAPE